MEKTGDWQGAGSKDESEKLKVKSEIPCRSNHGTGGKLNSLFPSLLANSQLPLTIRLLPVCHMIPETCHLLSNPKSQILNSKQIQNPNVQNSKQKQYQSLG